MIGALLVSPLPESDRAKYRSEMKKIARNFTLSPKVREVAQCIVERHRQNFPQVKG